MQPKPIEQALAEAAGQIEKSGWDSARATSLGGAAFCFGVVALLAQIGLSSAPLKVSFLLGSCGVPVWLGLWQIGEAYSFHGPRSLGHFAARGGVAGILLFLAGGLFAVGSFFSLAWHFMPAAALAFALLSIGAIALVVRHHRSVRASLPASN